MGILYVDEHKGCYNYQAPSVTNFSLHTIEKDKSIVDRISDFNYIIFIVKGRIKINCPSRKGLEYQTGEFILAPYLSEFDAIAVEDTEVLVHAFSSTLKLCERLTLESLSAVDISNNSMVVDHLVVNEQLHMFLDLLIMLLRDQVQCKHLHEIKHRELFLFLRLYYSKEELAHFFHPIIGKSVSFKALVMKHHLDAKNVKELAHLCNLSEREFHDRFMENFKETPHKWITARLSEHILFALQDQETSLADVAEQFRFSSQAHFTKFCKTNLGKTPKQIRIDLINSHLI